VKAATGVTPLQPHNVSALAGRPERFDAIGADVEAAKAYVRAFAKC
jgi:hypothetical protein